jgi:hypothetical protein
MKVSPLLILLLIGLGAWAYFGFPSPDTLLNWPVANDECVKFAKDNQAKLFFTSGDIRAVDSWIKNGKIVVELGAFQGNGTTYMPRLCVVGGGTIQIVSLLEAGAWR